MAGIEFDGVNNKIELNTGAAAADQHILFNGNAQDFYIALDDSADDLLIGLGSAVGTTPMLSFTEAKAASFAGAVTMASTLDVTTVATAATFEPDGDTSAADNAAIGYTSDEGLILTGQGAVTDVTVKNDADATVVSIPTGTTTVSIGSGSGVGHISSNGTNDLKLSTNSDTNSGNITITDGADEAITLTPNGAGVVDVQGSMNSSISSTGKSLVFGF